MTQGDTEYKRTLHRWRELDEKGLAVGLSVEEGREWLSLGKRLDEAERKGKEAKRE